MLILFWRDAGAPPSSSGSLSSTLGALVLAATAVVPAHGTGAATLGTLTASGTGKVEARGTFSQPLGPLSLAATGHLTAQGSLGATLEPLVLSGTGSAPSSPATGILSVELGPLTLAGSGALSGSIADQVEALLRESMVHHRMGIRAKRAGLLGEYVACLTRAYDDRVAAHALDPLHSLPYWANDRKLAPRPKDAHAALIAFYREKLGL